MGTVSARWARSQLRLDSRWLLRTRLNVLFDHLAHNIAQGCRASAFAIVEFLGGFRRQFVGLYPGSQSCRAGHQRYDIGKRAGLRSSCFDHQSGRAGSKATKSLQYPESGRLSGFASGTFKQVHQRLLGGGKIASNKRVYSSTGDGFDKFVFFGQFQSTHPTPRLRNPHKSSAARNDSSAIVRIPVTPQMQAK